MRSYIAFDRELKLQVIQCSEYAKIGYFGRVYEESAKILERKIKEISSLVKKEEKERGI